MMKKITLLLSTLFITTSAFAYMAEIATDGKNKMYMSKHVRIKNDGISSVFRFNDGAEFAVGVTKEDCSKGHGILIANKEEQRLPFNINNPTKKGEVDLINAIGKSLCAYNR